VDRRGRVPRRPGRRQTSVTWNAFLSMGGPRPDSSSRGVESPVPIVFWTCSERRNNRWVAPAPHTPRDRLRVNVGPSSCIPTQGRRTANGRPRENVPVSNLASLCRRHQGRCRTPETPGRAQAVRGLPPSAPASECPAHPRRRTATIRTPSSMPGRRKHISPHIPAVRPWSLCVHSVDVLS